MKPTAGFLFQQEIEESGGLAVMDVDETDPLEFLGEFEKPPLDADFFNSFEDDFDDTDVNN